MFFGSLTGSVRWPVPMLMATLLWSCAAAPPSWLAVEPTPPDAVPVPTSSRPTRGQTCPTALLAHVRLAGDPDASPTVWVERTDGAHMTVLWPFGFYARFDPTLQLHSGDGTLVAEGGEILDLGGAGRSATTWEACQIKGTWYTWPG